jgi:hypothetical protein
MASGTNAARGHGRPVRRGATSSAGRRPLGDDELVIDLEPEASAERSAWLAPAGPADGPGDGRAVVQGIGQAVDLEPTRLGAVTERAVVAVRGFVDDGGVSASGWAPSIEPVRDVGTVVMTHYLLGPPEELLAAIDRFFVERHGRCRSLWGSVRLAPAVVDRPVLAAWRGQLRMCTSTRPIPFELDAERWRSVGLMVTLRPVRPHGRRIGAHRRWAWFHTGHGVLEQVRRAVEDPVAAC